MRFGRLVVTKRFSDENRKKCEVTCDCGMHKSVTRTSLVEKNAVSCGCYNIERITGFNRKHGAYKTLLYGIWQQMRFRCTNPNNESYAGYGGRGIRVCPQWDMSFETFRDDMGPRPSLSHTLDRINNDGNYEPGNVRWATASQQARNRKTTRMVKAWGETKSVIEWSEDARCKVAFGTLSYRIRLNCMDPEDAITTPAGSGPGGSGGSTAVKLRRARLGDAG